MYSSKPPFSIIKIGAVLVMFFFIGLMVEITCRYIPMHTDVSFLMIKQTEVKQIPYYLGAFYVHVYAAIFTLIAGLTQFSAYILKQYKRLHRMMGYIYVVSVLVFAATSGLVMAFHANGGWVAQLFFVVLAILWWWYTFKALLAIKSQNITEHKAYMIRSYALCLSAITLRLWKFILVNTWGGPPMDVYVVVSGLSWVPNLLIAEYIINKQQLLIKNKSQLL